MAWWHTNVPPRWNRRATASPVRRSICCATISPSRSDSVKFFEPTTILSRRPHAASEATIARAHTPPSTALHRPRPPVLSPAPRTPPRHAAEDVHAQSAGADGGRDRRRPHAHHGGHAHAREHHPQSERQLDLRE